MQGTCASLCVCSYVRVDLFKEPVRLCVCVLTCALMYLGNLSRRTAGSSDVLPDHVPCTRLWPPNPFLGRTCTHARRRAANVGQCMEANVGQCMEANSKNDSA